MVEHPFCLRFCFCALLGWHHYWCNWHCCCCRRQFSLSLCLISHLIDCDSSLSCCLVNLVNVGALSLIVLSMVSLLVAALFLSSCCHLVDDNSSFLSSRYFVIFSMSSSFSHFLVDGLSPVEGGSSLSCLLVVLLSPLAILLIVLALSLLSSLLLSLVVLSMAAALPLVV